MGRTLPAALALALPAAALALALLAAPAAAGPRLSDLRGHLTLGYTRLFADESPAGSFAAGTGVDLPVRPGWRAGVELNYHLLGSRALVQGSLTSDLDYSVVEGLALVHWEAPGAGPLWIVSGGPGVFSARADLSASGTGAAFSRRAIGETRVGLAGAVTVLRRAPAPVRAGLELGVRWIPLDAGTWTLATARVALHY